MSPWQPPHPCPAPHCPRLLRPGERCPDHPPFAGSTYRERSPIPRGLRERILKRDGHACRTCGAPATDVDHIIPRYEHGSDDPENLQSLCRQHHRSKTGRDARHARGSLR